MNLNDTNFNRISTKYDTTKTVKNIKIMYNASGIKFSHKSRTM